MILLESVDKIYREGVRGRRITALRGLSLHIGAGEVFGFLGPNGAGKSTTIKLLMDLIRPDSGRVLLNGAVVTDPQVRQQVGYLPENPFFYDYLTARELLWFGGRSAGMGDVEIQERSDVLLKRVDLCDAANRSLRTYSKGMVQRAGLALALIHNPSIVILDEPMSGLDPLGRKMVVDLILELKRLGKTVFFSSHILSDAERICDRVGIVAQGELRFAGRLDELPGGPSSLEQVFIETVSVVQGGRLS